MGASKGHGGKHSIVLMWVSIDGSIFGAYLSRTECIWPNHLVMLSLTNIPQMSDMPTFLVAHHWLEVTPHHSDHLS